MEIKRRRERREESLPYRKTMATGWSMTSLSGSTRMEIMLFWFAKTTSVSRRSPTRKRIPRKQRVAAGNGAVMGVLRSSRTR